MPTNPTREGDEAHRISSSAQPSLPQGTDAGQLLDIALIEAVWNGPLPPPNVLRGYEEIVPGSAQRIMEMAEKEQEHSRNMVSTVIVGDSRRAYLGLIAGFIISILGIGGGIYLISTGHDWAGLSLAGINLTGLVGVFVYGAKTRHDERNRDTEHTAE